MYVTIPQPTLTKGLAVVGRAVATRTTLPVLSNILLSTDEGRLKLAATNLEIGVTCWLGAQVQDDGAITLPARLLTEWVNSVTLDRVTLDLHPARLSVALKCGRFASNIKGIDANEYPLLPTAEHRTPLALAPVVLRQAVAQVTLAASDPKDTSRPALTGILVRATGDRLTLVGTDGYRLAVRTVTLAQPAGEWQAILPARALSEVSRIGAEADPDQPVLCSVDAQRRQAAFRLCGTGNPDSGGFERVELVTQLIDAKYPDYSAILPKACTTRAGVAKAELQRALKVAGLFARDASDRVRLAFVPASGQAGAHLRVTATSAEIGDQESELAAEIAGPELEMAFNAAYLQQALAVIDTPQVALETTKQDRPGVLRPVGAGAEDYTHVIMPMKLQR